MGRHDYMCHLPSSVAQDHQTIELPEGRGGNGEEVHSSEMLAVVMKEGSPGLTLRLFARRLPEKAGYRGLGDSKAEHAQLAVNAWGTPEWILLGDPEDCRDHVRPSGWSSEPSPRLPSPICAEPCSVPGHDSGRGNEQAGRSPSRPDPGEEHPEDAIPPANLWPGLFAFERDQLLAQGKILHHQIEAVWVYPGTETDGQPVEEGLHPSNCPEELVFSFPDLE